jgi:hypothetical protein
VHHLSEAGIFVLEQLGDAEEEGGGFIGRELLPGVEEKSNLGEQDSASSRLDGALVEYTCCNVALVVEVLHREWQQPWDTARLQQCRRRMALNTPS